MSTWRNPVLWLYFRNRAAGAGGACPGAPLLDGLPPACDAMSLPSLALPG